MKYSYKNLETSVKKFVFKMKALLLSDLYKVTVNVCKRNSIALFCTDILILH
jgi:hypothetical protein